MERGSWLDRMNMMKVGILPTLICGFNAISIKILRPHFIDLVKKFKNFMDSQKTTDS